MDKLQWFKFSPNDFMMGNISRLPISTQGHFVRLCCIYWNKECQVPENDLNRMIPKSASKKLIEYEIIKIRDSMLVIEFLDEQMEKIAKISEANRQAGLRSAEARKQRSLTSVQRNPTDKDKEKEKNIIDDNTIYRQFGHLSITYGELRKLQEVYSLDSITQVLDNIENWKHNSHYKSLYLTARKWLRGNDTKSAPTESVPEVKELKDNYADNIMKKLGK